MEVEGLSHLDKRTQDRIKRYTEKVKNIAKDELVSIILYGNATKEDFNIKQYPLNFLVVLKNITVDFLTAYAKLRRQFHNIATPLLLTPELIKTSLDTFPIEFLSLKESYIPLLGEDIFKDTDIRFEDLRYEIEQQIKRRLMKVREEFLYSLERKADLEQLLTTFLISFTPLFKNILRLINKECSVEGTLFREFCEAMGLDEKPFFEIWAIKTGEKSFSKKRLLQLFGDFVKEIEVLASRLDSIQPINPVCR